MYVFHYNAHYDLLGTLMPEVVILFSIYEQSRRSPILKHSNFHPIELEENRSEILVRVNEC